MVLYSFAPSCSIGSISARFHDPIGLVLVLNSMVMILMIYHSRDSLVDSIVINWHGIYEKIMSAVPARYNIYCDGTRPRYSAASLASPSATKWANLA